ncbi:MAG: GNAT family N-acetyltransferase [Nitrospirales bacterium]
MASGNRELKGALILFRPWRRGDEEAIVAHANHREIWRNLMDRFPHPYTRTDADEWVAKADAHEGPTEQFAIVLDGDPVGGIGLIRLRDIRHKTAEIGYWVGRTFWGRGIATEAVGLFADYVFRAFDVERLEATIFAWNPASACVLEKAGFECEAHLARALVKDGQVADGLLYRRLRPGSRETP